MSWDHITFLAGLVAAWSLLIIGTTRFVISRSQAQYDAKLKEMETALSEVRALRADLPLHYVRREDFIGNDLKVNAKLDKLWERLDTAGFISKEDFIRHETGVSTRLEAVAKQIDGIRERLK